MLATAVTWLTTVRQWIRRAPKVEESPAPQASPGREFTYDDFRAELDPRIEQLRQAVAQNTPSDSGRRDADQDLLRDCCKGIVDARSDKPPEQRWRYPTAADPFVGAILRSLGEADRELAPNDVARLEDYVREQLGC